MKYERTMELRDAAAKALGEVLAAALHDSYTAEQAAAARASVLAGLPPSMPEQARQYLFGYWQRGIHELYEKCLIYGGWWRPAPETLKLRPALQAVAYMESAGEQLQPMLFVSTNQHLDSFYEHLGLTKEAFAMGGLVTQKGYWWPAGGTREVPQPWLVDDTNPQYSCPWLVDVPRQIYYG